MLSSTTFRACALLAAALVAGAATAGRLPAQIALVSNSVIEHHARVGERVQGVLLIKNAGAAAAEARIYQTGYTFSADGRAEFGAAAAHPRSNARWITFSPDHVVVPPGATVSVTYTLAVPAIDSLHGTYWSVLMVEGVPRSASPANTAVPQRPHVGLTMLTRYATQIAASIDGRSAPRLTFDSLGVTGALGGRQARLDVVNTGDVGLRLRMTAELYSEAGVLVATAEQQRGLLYPGTSLRQSFDFGRVPPGQYRLVVAADPGLEQLFGGQFQIRF